MPATPVARFSDESSKLSDKEVRKHFELNYDALVIAVGAYNQSETLSDPIA